MNILNCKVLANGEYYSVLLFLAVLPFHSVSLLHLEAASDKEKKHLLRGRKLIMYLFLENEMYYTVCLYAIKPVKDLQQSTARMGQSSNKGRKALLGKEFFERQRNYS